MLVFTLWQWGSTKPYYDNYGPDQVQAAAVKIIQNCHLPESEYDIVVLTDKPEQYDDMLHLVRPIKLWDTFKNMPEGATMPPGTWNRLGIFAPGMESYLGFHLGTDIWVLNIDLDCVFRDDFTPAIRDYRNYTFKGWLSRGFRATPTIYNASFFLLKLSAHPEVWESFDPKQSPLLCKLGGYIGTEQAWYSRVLGPDMPAWTWRDGIASYRFQCKSEPPAGTSIVAMHGSEKPMWSNEPWVVENYPEYARRPKPRGKGPTG